MKNLHTIQGSRDIIPQSYLRAVASLARNSYPRLQARLTNEPTMLGPALEYRVSPTSEWHRWRVSGVQYWAERDISRELIENARQRFVE